MAELAVTVRFLDARFHGRGDGGRPEWPPSPMRLFQALVAVAKPCWTPDLAEAFRWLEGRSPPIIHVPPHREGQPCLTYVPSNNTDATLGDVSGIRTGKLIRPTLIEGRPEVHYRWPVEPHEEALAKRIADVSGKLAVLGWGIDLAVGRGEVRSGPPRDLPESHLELRASGGPDMSGTLLRIPVRGTLQSLEEAHDAHLSRISKGRVLLDAPGLVRFAQVPYSTSPPRPFVAFALERPGQEGVSRRVRPGQIKELVGMIRGAIGALGSVGPYSAAELDSIVMGHPRDYQGPRLAILPVPSVGHPHSDGRIRRVLLVEAWGADGALSRALGGRLHGQDLVPGVPGEDLSVRLVRIESTDPVVRRFTGVARTWASVTPVLLPGYDKRRDHRRNHQKRLARAEGLVGKALRQADVPLSAAIGLSRVPFVPGTGHVREYRPREKLRHYPRYHVRLTFEGALTGPLSLGAGRYAGFGVMAAVDG
jgi:CRISPR-associated protein Csb2